MVHITYTGCHHVVILNIQFQSDKMAFIEHKNSYNMATLFHTVVLCTHHNYVLITCHNPSQAETLRQRPSGQRPPTSQTGSDIIQRPLCVQTNTPENIILPQTSFAGSNYLLAVGGCLL